MKIITLKEFVQCMEILETAIGQGKRFIPRTLKLWFEFLCKEGVSNDDLTDAGIRLLETCKYLPTYSEIINAVRDAKKNRLETEHQNMKSARFDTNEVFKKADTPLAKKFCENLKMLLEKKISGHAWQKKHNELSEKITVTYPEYPTCGQCSGFDGDFLCKKRRVNYYGPTDKSLHPRRTLLTTTFNTLSITCEFYSARVERNIFTQS